MNKILKKLQIINSFYNSYNERSVFNSIKTKKYIYSSNFYHHIYKNNKRVKKLYLVIFNIF